MTINNKGLSPLIAVVLLIAVTITVASIIAAFSQSFVTRQTGQFQQTEEQRTSCQFANIVIQSATYDDATDRVSTVITNTGSSNLTDWQLNVFYDETSFDKKTPTNSNKTLTIGDFETFNATGVTTRPQRIQAQSLDCPREALYTCVYDTNTARYNC